MNKTKKLLAIIFVVVLSISLIPTTNVSAAKKVKLNKTKATIYVGKTVTLKLKNNKKKVKWTTSNKKIATVSKKGKVKGKKAGKVTITAKVGKKKYKCKITVKKKTTVVPPTTTKQETTTAVTEKPTSYEQETTGGSTQFNSTDWKIEGTTLIEYLGTDTKVVIPDGITEIGESAFENCSNLTSIKIPDSVTYIGYRAFQNCSNLSEIVIPSSVSSCYGSTFEGTKWIEKRRKENPLVIINNLLVDGKVCTGDVVIPNNVISIKDEAFEGNSNIKSVIIPDSVTYIGYGAFQNCSNLASIEIPDSVTSTGWYAFAQCNSLTDITIPGSIEYISFSAFYGCSNLSNVTILEGTTSIVAHAFMGCKKLECITIPESVTDIDWETGFMGCDNLTTIKGKTGSYAESFANTYGYTFVAE